MGDNREMESYIVRIYRRNKDELQGLAGIVESVRMEERIPFSNLGELCRILENGPYFQKDNAPRTKKKKGRPADAG
ncbi:hypothetical protein BMS3Abin07_00471 [bacterium BMS3Abin07]|nr:hypothetical protein BMS3Abin07_00471 [bacterium BMS3Abin07]GBE31630.1 hypothetical protein BMS3Bbin05_00533 [bacterium BMS3Bbin05]